MSDYSLNVAFALFTFGVIDYCVSVALVLFTFGSTFAQQWMYLLKRAVTSNDVSSNFSFFFMSRASNWQLFVPVATRCLGSMSALGIELFCDNKIKCKYYWMNRKSPTFITLLLLSLICPHYIYLWICFETDKICSLLHIYPSRNWGKRFWNVIHVLRKFSRNNQNIQNIQILVAKRPLLMSSPCQTSQTSGSEGYSWKKSCSA